jgi:hypothetical protein
MPWLGFEPTIPASERLQTHTFGGEGLRSRHDTCIAALRLLVQPYDDDDDDDDDDDEDYHFLSFS